MTRSSRPSHLSVFALNKSLPLSQVSGLLLPRPKGTRVSHPSISLQDIPLSSGSPSPHYRAPSGFSSQVSIARTQVSEVLWTEIKRNRDFFEWNQPVDWIINNPPWSQIRLFLQHAMSVAPNVVFLLTINHLWTKARLRDIHDAGFGVKEIVLVDMPGTFPASGFQLGAVHLQRGWRGKITLTDFSFSCRTVLSRRSRT